jgi:hypothetical protein
VELSLFVVITPFCLTSYLIYFSNTLDVLETQPVPLSAYCSDCCRIPTAVAVVVAASSVSPPTQGLPIPGAPRLRLSAVES